MKKRDDSLLVELRMLKPHIDFLNNVARGAMVSREVVLRVLLSTQIERLRLQGILPLAKRADPRKKRR